MNDYEQLTALAQQRENERLRARVEELEAALEPFAYSAFMAMANSTELYYFDGNDNPIQLRSKPFGLLTFGDIYAAQRALKG